MVLSCFFKATNLNFPSKMRTNLLISPSFWQDFAVFLFLWPRIFPSQLVIAKNCKNSLFGEKSCQICANLATFALFTGVISQ